MNRWDDLVALAREIDAAVIGGASIAPDKARLLAQLVLAVTPPPDEANGHGAAAGSAGTSPHPTRVPGSG